MPLIQLIYRSRSLVEPRRSASVLNAILSQAERQNRSNGVTGCLAHTDTHFVQLLEGSAESVDATFVRIRRDNRHRDVEIMLTRPVRSRAFPDWCMSQFNASSAHAASPFAMLGLTQGFSLESTPPSQLLMLLMTIADQKRLAA